MFRWKHGKARYLDFFPTLERIFSDFLENSSFVGVQLTTSSALSRNSNRPGERHFSLR